MNRLKGHLTPFISLFCSQLKSMALGILLGFTAVAASVGLLALSGWFLAATAAAGLSAKTAIAFNFFLPSIGVRILAISRTLTRYGERLASHNATFKILADLRIWFYKNLEPLAPARLMSYGSGDILSRIVGDIDALDNLYLRVISPIVIASAATIALVLFLMRIDDAMALISAVAALGAGGGISFWNARMGRRAGQELVDIQSRLKTRMVEGLQGLAELLIFNLKERYFSLIADDHHRLTAGQAKMAHLTGAANALLTLFSGTALLAVLVVGVKLVNSGGISGETLTLAALAVMAVFEAFWQLPSAFQYLSHTRRSAARLTEIVNAPPTVNFPEQTSATIEGIDLRLENISFRYGDESHWILKDFSLNIPGGSKLALVGASGAGKSTLVHLLMRFWMPQEGSIYFGQKDIRLMSESDLRKNMVLISQNAHIFNGTIRSNLMLADSRATEKTLWDALAAVYLDELVKQMPQKLDTWVGEGGKELSGGQRKRLAVARTFLSKAPIWILDEPTEGLDSVTESKLMDRLLTTGQTKTIIVVTHRQEIMDRFKTRVQLASSVP